MNSFAGKRVLLTGAGGFIGSHIADLLVEGDADAVAFFHYNGRNETGLISPATLSNVEPVFGNLSDATAVANAVKGCDAVIHIAASISIPYSYQNPREVFDVNAIGTMNVLQACVEAGVDRVVVTSTSEVYGSADILPITETHPLKPQSPYAGSKVASDAMARSYYCSYGLPVIIARPFNTYGPRQSDRAIIPTIIKQAIWRDKIVVGALSPLRDFVFVKDTAQGFLECMMAGPEVNGEVIQFATNESWSVQQVIDIVQDILGTGAPIETSEFRKRPNMSEVTHLLGTNEKAHKLLGWHPNVSFRDGLCQTIDYIRDRKDQFAPERYGV